MQVGKFFTSDFDGQSAIARASRYPPHRLVIKNRAYQTAGRYVGMNSLIKSSAGAALTGQFLSLAPWMVSDISGSLESRRKYLRDEGVRRAAVNAFVTTSLSCELNLDDDPLQNPTYNQLDRAYSYWFGR